MKIKIKNMDFRENRLVFQEAPGSTPVAGGGAADSSVEECRDEIAGDVKPPDYPPVFITGDAEGYEYTGDATAFVKNDVRMKADANVPGAYIYEIYDGQAWVGFTPPESWSAPAPAAPERAEVADKTGAKLLELNKVTSFLPLIEKLGDDFKKVVEVLKDKKLTGEIMKGQLMDGFLFLGGEDAFKEAVKTQLTEADITTLQSAFGTVYDLEGVDFREFLPKIAAVATLGVFQSTIQEKYPHILTFDKFKDGTVKINYDLNFDPENPALNLSLSSGAQPLYDTHAAAEQKKVEDAAQQQQAAATQEAQAQELANNKEAFKDQLRQNPIGAFLVDFFDGPGPDGKPGIIDKLFDKKSPILAFLLGALGVGKFKKDYDNVRRMADKNPKLKGLLDQVEERVKPYRVDTPEAAVAAAAGTAPAEAPKFTQMDKKKFDAVISGHEVPDGGVQLSEDYTITRGQKLKVDLSGGSLILPKGASLNILDSTGNEGRESALDDKNRPFNDIKLVLIKAIPKETIFTKGAKLELV